MNTFFITLGLILLIVSLASGAYFLYRLKQEMKEGFAQFALRIDNKDVIKAIESIEIKADLSDVIKTVEGATNEILVKIDSQTETITSENEIQCNKLSEKMENLTFHIE